ncbi:hypothetical protein CASFOL_036874 [Castilleja foliolosa]|uniref:Uncharacterized protein n=1 Tax=Castilleja foliolosa TaxID=1961234 RepID=A0ABD3BPU7_9LAMI
MVMVMALGSLEWAEIATNEILEDVSAFTFSGEVRPLNVLPQVLKARLWSMEIGTKPMVEDFQRSVVIERDEKERQWRVNRRTLIWGVTQSRKTLIEEGNSKSAGTAVLVRGCLVLVDGIGWGGGRFLVPEPVDGGALKWSRLTTKFRLGGVAWRPGDGRRLHLVVTRRWSRHLWGDVAGGRTAHRFFRRGLQIVANAVVLMKLLLPITRTP